MSEAKDINKENEEIIENKEEENKKKKQKRRPNVGGTFWLGIAILIILLLLSIIVLGIRLGDYAHVDDREVMLKSNMDTELDIFSVTYKNKTGEITVEGLDGEKVIAPGTDVDYTVRLRNKDNIAIDYTLIVQVALLENDRLQSGYDIPLLYRMLDPDDNYLAGDAKTWATRESLDGLADNGTIPRGESSEYLFQWKWPFEADSDEYDTFLGNIADEDVGIKVTFVLRAEANTSIEANGGFWRSGLGRTVLWWIFFLLLLLAIILLLISVFKRRKVEPEPEPVMPEPEPEPIIIPEPEPVIIPEPVILPDPEPEIIIIPDPEPEPEPEPIVVPPPVEPVFKEGFVGKMAFINIDVLDEYFADGDLITLKILKAKGLIHPAAKQMKVLARNGATLTKAFTIETQGASADARKYITQAGGKIIITKG